MPDVGITVRNVVSPVANRLSHHRGVIYVLCSVAAVAVTVLQAMNKHSNFYSVAVSLSRSSRSVIIFVNFGAVLALIWGRILQSIFFGPLRTAEVEVRRFWLLMATVLGYALTFAVSQRLYDRMWYFVTESLLAFTIFRDEFDATFIMQFGLLLFIKCFHWLLADRIDWMNTLPFPGPPPIFHFRALSLFVLLWLVDMIMVTITLESIRVHGVSALVLFGSEYAILLVKHTSTLFKYMINLHDLRRASLEGGESAPPWEEKTIWVFYVELLTDFFKLAIYMSFFVLVMAYYGLPLNIVRDVYITGRSFVVRIREFLKYRQATRNMDERYPSATEAELNAMSDRTCIICREEMVFTDNQSNNPPQPGAVPPAATPVQAEGAPQQRRGPNMTAKKLPCGHLFHFYCLRSWLERQQNCPTCRRPVLERRANSPARALNQPPAAPQPGQAPNADPANRQANIARFFGMGNAVPAQQGQPRPQPQAQQRPPQPQVYQQPDAFQWMYEGDPQFQAIRPAQTRGTPPVTPATQVRPRPPPTPTAFDGFYLDEQRWMPWARPPATPVAGGSNTTSTPGAAPSPGGTSTPASPTTPPAPSIQGGATSPDDRTNGPSPSPTPTTGTSSDLRHAAAMAALRRSQSSRNVGSLTSQTGNQPPSTPLNSNTLRSSTPSTPPLIPLYDPIGSRAAAQRLAAERAAAASRSLLPTKPPHSSSIPQMPPNLTPQQLELMSKHTRQSLDAQLQVLESVSAHIQQCADVLLQTRSVLPPATSGPMSAPPLRVPQARGQGRAPTAASGPGVAPALLSTGTDAQTPSASSISPASGVPLNALASSSVSNVPTSAFNFSPAAAPSPTTPQSAAAAEPSSTPGAEASIPNGSAQDSEAKGKEKDSSDAPSELSADAA